MQLREVALFSKSKYMYFFEKKIEWEGTCLKECATPYLLQEYPSFSSFFNNTFNMIFHNKNKVGAYALAHV